MNILVIGNGFDLAHGLPTKYTDFLNFIKLFADCYEKARNEQMDWCYFDTRNEVNAFLKKWFSSYYENENGQSKEEKEITINTIKEFKTNIEDNIWIEYFINNSMYKKENWIDFESEISKVIKSLDGDMHGLNETYSLDDEIATLSNDFLRERYSEYTFTVQQINMLNGKKESESITFKEIRNKLLDDLNRLIRALEIYLCEFVEKIEPQKKSPDIDGLDIDFILSFNYTHTFSKLYIELSVSKQEADNPFDYIHGKANINNSIESNNMVLGIDEYLPEDRKNKDIEFIAFKKYYQRIYKQTGCKYKKWVESIQKDTEKKNMWLYDNQDHSKDHCHNLYIFGHSLDITDKDILRDLILNDNVYTTIFYHDKDTMGQQIANLVKVIGQDELIRRTGGSTKTIEFKQQQDMVPINN